MSIDLAFSDNLNRIHNKRALSVAIKTKLVELFQDLTPLRGDCGLILEIMIQIESMRHPLKQDADKYELFLEVYNNCFGNITEHERMMLKSLVDHLRESKQIYRRSRIGNLVRLILRFLRA